MKIDMVGTKASLSQLATKHGTDKGPSGHNYTAIYETIFESIRDKPLKILEIGVLDGASLRMWCDYFPNAEIHGLDINPDCKAFADSRITIHTGAQDDKDLLDSIGVDFDIVIDDGSHQVADQIATFKHLWANTKLIYVVEDIYTSYLAMYGGGYRRSGTAVEFFKDLVDDLHAKTYETSHKSKTIHVSSLQVGMIQFSKNIVCIYKAK